MNSTIVDILLLVPYQLNIYIGCFYLIAGNIGCFGNIIVFSCRSFRQRTYSIYFLFESISNLIYFDFLLLTRLLQRGFQIPITTRYDILCKIRQFDSVWNHVVSLTLFTLGTIDRILSLQRSLSKLKTFLHVFIVLFRILLEYRKWSNRHDLTYKLTSGCVIFWLIFFGHRLILYSIINGKCIPMPGIYAIFDNYIEACITAMGTPIVMIILGILILRSVRGITHRHINLGNPSPSQRTIVKQTLSQQIDTQLTVILLVQLSIALITRIPYATYLIYSNLTQNQNKSPYQIAVESITSEVVNLMSYTFFTSSFYVSLTTNRGFRRNFMNFFKTKQIHDLSTHS